MSRADFDRGEIVWQHGDNPEACYREPIIGVSTAPTDVVERTYAQFAAWINRVHDYALMAPTR